MMGAHHLAQLIAFMLALLRYSRPLAEQAGWRLSAHRPACSSGKLSEASVLSAADHNSLVFGRWGLLQKLSRPDGYIAASAK